MPCGTPALHAEGTSIQSAETVLTSSRQSSAISLQLQPTLLTLCALKAPTVAHIILFPSATDLLAPPAQAALVERKGYFTSELIMML